MATSAGLPQRVQIGQGVHFTSIHDPKFKHNRITVHAILPLTAETASENTIVPLLLRKGCRSYPDFSALNLRLNQLYGASLSTNTGTFNGYQLLTLSIQAIDDRFALEGENITAACTDLLADLLLEPVLTEEGLFPAQDVALERQYILDTIAAEINDKQSYALTQCLRQMTKGEPLSIRRYGELETAEAITPQSATAAWNRLLRTAKLELFFTGCGTAESAQETFAHRLGGLVREPIAVPLIPIRDTADTVQQITEEMDVQQGNLVLGFRVAGLTTPEKQYAASLFSAIYGGTPFSRLFLNVREKLSLCYYCSASIDTINNLLFVRSGIEVENKEKAEAEILRQLEEMQAGDITETQLSEAKLLLTGSIRKVEDSLGGLERWYLTRTLLNETMSPRQYIEKLMAVPLAAIAESAKAVTLDTVYLLRGPENGKGAIQ